MDEVEVIGLEIAGSAVEAFPSLEVLRFEHMLSWEGWSTKNEGLDAMFPSLQELQLKNCPDLINVSLEALPLLRVLSICYCDDSALRSLVQAASLITKMEINSILGLTDEVWRGVIEYLGAVEELNIRRCGEIRYLWESEAEASKVLINLKILKVFGCYSLVSLGEKEEEDNFDNNLLSSLRRLDVMSCFKMERCCCPNSISIESLDITFCRLLTRVSFPTTTTQRGGQRLKSLEIFECEKLMETINNTSLPMLETLRINSWINLKLIIQVSNSIHLTSLYIQGCPNIKSFPDLQLSNLIDLRICSCKNLESFPRGIWPPKLCFLRIGGLKKPILEWGDQNFPSSRVYLWLCCEPQVNNLSQLSHLLPSSLTHLIIDEFDNLESLSMGLQHLSFLQDLLIFNCPEMICNALFLVLHGHCNVI